MIDLRSWTSRPAPGQVAIEGARIQLEPLDWDDHGSGLFAAVGGPANAALWTWMPVGPFPARDDLGCFLLKMRTVENWRTMAIRDRVSGEIEGMASYMRIREAHGSAEIGCVAFGPRLSRTAQATEALWLMADHVFAALGYRRYEWKCNTANAASMRAAARFGFIFEGVFRNDMVMKGGNRDTAWFSITGEEWPALRAATARWLAPDNFGADGEQVRTLESLRAPA